jgi:C-terminal processing protease CtpA/Prc
VEAFNAAMIAFAIEFNDGHVGTSFTQKYIDDHIGGRLGMRLAELDNGDVIVISVTDGLPADEAGIELGATILEWNGQSPVEAAGEEQLLFGASSEHARHLQQYEFLTRGPLDDEVTVTFANPDSDEETVDLTYSEDIESRDFFANTDVSLGADYDPAQLPVDASLLDTGIGYIKINTFSTDPLLMTNAWDTAITTLNQLGAVGLIIDVRDNGGGYGNLPLYIAGSFYDEPFEFNELYYIDEQGNNILTDTEEVVPNEVQWDAPVALLIDESCASACEIFSAAMAENPDHQIVGYTPTAGVEASVFFWALPGDISFQASVGRMERDGELFLEGVGVPPNVPVEWTAENLLNPEDEMLQIAQEALIPLIQDYFADLDATATAEAEASATAAAEETPEEDASPDEEASPEATIADPDATPEA